MAEREGFEPSIDHEPIPVFETGAFNHSATSPTRTSINVTVQMVKLLTTATRRVPIS